MSWFAMSTSSSVEAAEDVSDESSTSGLRHGTHVMTKLLGLSLVEPLFEKLPTVRGERGSVVTLKGVVPFI